MTKALLILSVLFFAATMQAQAPDTDTLQLQLRAASEQITALRFQLDTCSGEVAQARYQKAQQADSDALKALIAEVQAKHPKETVTLGPQGFVFTPKPTDP